MVAHSDFDCDLAGPPLRGGDPGIPVRDGGRGLVRIVLRLAGAGLIAAALGLWVLPTHGADPAMMLIKLLFSIGLFWSGALCLHAARLPDRRPEVQVDRTARELRVLTRGHGGVHHVSVHPLDDLPELSLRDGLLSARDRSGRLVVSLHVAGRYRERLLREALAAAR